jgi:thymidylate synthase ThyX
VTLRKVLPQACLIQIVVFVNVVHWIAFIKQHAAIRYSRSRMRSMLCLSSALTSAIFSSIFGL